jgi:hypothetical protein
MEAASDARVLDNVARLHSLHPFVRISGPKPPEKISEKLIAS